MTSDVRTRPKDRRASILAAASVRFYRYGYAGTSLEDIAGDLGITAPAIYRHFRGKDALYTAALEANLRQLEECVANAKSSDEAVRGLARIGVEHPTLGLIWTTDRRRLLVDPDGAIEARLVAAADALGALFQDDTSPELAHLLARLALAALSSTGFYESAFDSDAQVAELAAVLRSIAVFRPSDSLVLLVAVGDTSAVRPWATRRSALLDAGAYLAIQGGGFQSVTIEDIAVMAGVSPASVYVEYAGKVDLLAAVLRRAVNWAMAAIQQASSEADSVDDALERAVVSSLELSARHPSWTGSLADEVANLPIEQGQDVVANVNNYLDEWLGLCAAIVPELETDAVLVRMRAVLAVLNDRALEAVDRRVLSMGDMVALVHAILESE